MSRVAALVVPRSEAPLILYGIERGQGTRKRVSPQKKNAKAFHDAAAEGHTNALLSQRVCVRGVGAPSPG